MTSGTLRRRLHHGDVDGKKREHVETEALDFLSEPLLGSAREVASLKDDYESDEDTLDEKKRKEKLHWAHLFSQLIAHWAQFLGSGTIIGRLLPLPLINSFGSEKKNRPFFVSPLQEERLRLLQQRMGVPFDGSRLDHQDALKQLWRLAYPCRELPSLKSEVWKEMGWQGSDPSTDFRGGGYISLENLIFFAQKYPDSFQNLLHKKEGRRSDWEYPFAVAGVNVSFMLVQMLDLQSGPPTSIVATNFARLLAEDEMAFDNLFCVAFMMLDAQWLAKRASYMEFNEVLKSTRTQLERELSLDDVYSVRDLPAYNLLRR
ncbi:ELMO domain-containing protein A [Nymphaea thermarum]|nr:ELMO domain-containing protein A [Nymphaea thermarum]